MQGIFQIQTAYSESALSQQQIFVFLEIAEKHQIF